jgi:cysteine desulfurase / selenocysteine lyase
VTRILPMAGAGEIPALADCAWLYTGAEGPPLAIQAEALNTYLANRALASAGRDAHAEVEARLRLRLARMLGYDAGDIALVSNAGEAMNLVAQSIEMQPGDNVVVNDLEFPSVVQPWLRLAGKGIEVRVARHAGPELPAADIVSLVDERTRVVAFSHVSYQSGWRHDVDALSEAATQAGALLLMDATQSLGALPVPAARADVVVCSSYKWLLGGHGLGILAWNRARRPLPEPPSVGWRSVADTFAADRFQHYHLHDDARRFETGFPSFPAIYALDTSVAWLGDFDAAAVLDHILTLSGRLVAELAGRGCELLTPAEPARRSGNVSFGSAAGAELASYLAAEGIHCWGGDGRVRVSLHLFNGDDDIDRLLAALDGAPARLRPWDQGPGSDPVPGPDADRA